MEIVEMRRRNLFVTKRLWHIHLMNILRSRQADAFYTSDTGLYRTPNWKNIRLFLKILLMQAYTNPLTSVQNLLSVNLDAT